MRILVVTPSYAPTVGGLERVLELLVEQWCERGHQVVVIARNDILLAQPIVRKRCRLLRALREARHSDVIVVANSTLRTLPYLAMFSRKTVLQHHSDYSAVKARPRLYRVLTCLIRSWWMRNTFNVAVSPWVAEQLRGKVRCLTVLPNPIYSRPRGDCDWSQRPFDFLFVGRLTRDKGLDVLLAALCGLQRSFRAAIVGDGPDRDLLARCAQFGQFGESEVVPLGPLHAGEAARAMGSARWVVVPSRSESFGLVAVEALGQGAGLVVSRVGGLAGYEGRCAYGFENEDVGGLSTVLSHCLDQAALPAKWSTKAERIVAHHHPGRAAERYLDYFNRVVLRAAEPGPRSSMR